MKNKIAYWSCQTLGWGTYTAIGMYETSRSVGWLVGLVVGYLLFFVYSLCLTELLRREIRRRRWLENISYGTIARLAAAAVLLAAVQAFLVSAIDLGFFGRQNHFVADPIVVMWTWIGLTAADIVWIMLYWALTASQRHSEKDLRLRDAELRALEGQINPHFLFNSLNSIRGLVAEDSNLAQDMITRFAALLRHNLNHDALHTVPLATEAEILKDYLALEKVRFEDRLLVQVCIDPEAGSFRVPPMILQTLAENALKHGIGRLPQGGELRIHAAARNGKLILEVENTGELIEPQPGGTHLGLNNIRERLRILYGNSASLSLHGRDGWVVATVQIPQTV